MPPLSRSSCGDSPPGKVLGDEVAAPGKKLGVSERGRSVGSLCIRCLVSMQSSGCPSSYTSSRDYGVGSRNSTAKVMSLCWERGGDGHWVWGWQGFRGEKHSSRGHSTEDAGASAGMRKPMAHKHTQTPPSLCLFSPLAKDRLVAAELSVYIQVRQ